MSSARSGSCWRMTASSPGTASRSSTGTSASRLDDKGHRHELTAVSLGLRAARSGDAGHRRRRGSAGGPLGRGQGHVRHRRDTLRQRQSDLAGDPPRRREQCRRGAEDSRRRRDHHRQDRVRRVLLQRHRRQRALRHAGQSARAGPAAGRLVERLGLRRGVGRVRLCARQRHRRLGAHPGSVQRRLWHPADAQPRRCGRRDGDGAIVRRARLVCVGARRVPQARRGAARRQRASPRRSRD